MPVHAGLPATKTGRPWHTGREAPDGQDRPLACSGSEPASQGLTVTVILNERSTTPGVKALARKNSSSELPGLRGVKKNSRVAAPPSPGSYRASRRPTRLAWVG